MSINEEIKSKLIGFAAAIFDEEECAQEIVDFFWTERIENYDEQGVTGDIEAVS